ncbi:MAG: hypothetical protein WDO16_23020 [Bacteroidota bacterium]
MANWVKQLADLPSGETAPSGNDNVQMVPRSFDWRDDMPASVTWCEPLDSGLYKKQMEYHDAVFQLLLLSPGRPNNYSKQNSASAI